ncbi:hypothetical protein E4U16_001687 [Claviceps sp. LM84 group G4]|nr:hypothetical protein E4U33_000959 [Claviceps sp. LM78 group G4]KAG6078372.1 hypothetical protein E4U16_001687 [Claviceps sp. LM84 group G4]
MAASLSEGYAECTLPMIRHYMLTWTVDKCSMLIHTQDLHVPAVRVRGGRGQERISLPFHSDLVKRESKAFGEIIDTSFVEGQKGYLVLRDDNAETVSAFAQFIYTGDYHLSFDMSASEIGNELHDEDNPEDDVPQSRPNSGLWRRFVQRNQYEDQVNSSNSYMTPCEASGSEIDELEVPYFNTRRMDKDYSELFISHARVCVFAQYYGVEALMDLSMQRLRAALCGFLLSRERIGDILALIRYCYEQPGPERLKKMVAMYSAAIVNSQVSDVVVEDFEDLLKERGDFAADMAWFLACRVSASNNSIEC